MKKSDNSLSETKKESKKSLVVSGIALLATFILFLFITVGWFASNKNVSATGMNVGANAETFNLFVVGEDSIFDKLHNPNLVHGADSTRTTRDGEKLTGYETIGVRDIEWVVNAEGNLKNYKYDKNGEIINDPDELGIEPGSYGHLEFYVVPLNDGTLDVNFEIEMTMFGQEYSVTEPVSGKYIAEPKGNNGNKIYFPELINESIMRLLSGHLMFFENRTELNGQYKYSNRVLDGKFSRKFENVEKGKLEKVDLYWVWPYVLGQTLLPSGDKYLGNFSRIFNDGDDEDSERFLIELSNKDEESTNYNDYLYQLAGDNLKYLDEISNITCGSDSLDYDADAFGTLSTYWNRADQFIGINVSYISLKVNAD